MTAWVTALSAPIATVASASAALVWARRWQREAEPHDVALTAILLFPILASAQAMGGADYALEITAEYSKVREQFDKPLAAFQALSHYMADAKTELDGGKILVYEAAWAQSRGDDITRLAPMAKLFTGNVYRDLTAMAQQIDGGDGFTLE